MVAFFAKLALALGLTAIFVGCASTSEDGVRPIAAAASAELIADAPENLRVIDLRTPEEFAEGHLEDAEMIDFYGNDFEALIADLPRDEPYLIYCRSGNRSGQTRLLMEDLGFTDVAELEGGILSWQQAGHVLVDS